MRIMLRSLLAFGMIMGVVTKVKAKDLYVPLQYSTIQVAIDAAADGDTVWVADGIYTGSGNTNLTWSGKRITVRSINGPENCIIDCKGSGRAFYFENARDCGTISGFTIKNGSVGVGDGIYCGWHSSPEVTNCTISSNSADYGGGIYCVDNSAPTATNSILWDNSVQEIYLDNSTIIITYSNIQGGWEGEGNIHTDPPIYRN